MAEKSRRRRRSPAASAAVQLVVRRGALRRFHKLKEKTANLPVEVSWDRRKNERRTAANEIRPDRRKTERRQTPPFTWLVSDFVVVGETRHRRGRMSGKKCR
jgi:hypothetical protein